MDQKTMTMPSEPRTFSFLMLYVGIFFELVKISLNRLSVLRVQEVIIKQD